LDGPFKCNSASIGIFPDESFNRFIVGTTDGNLFILERRCENGEFLVKRSLNNKKMVLSKVNLEGAKIENFDHLIPKNEEDVDEGEEDFEQEEEDG